MKEPRFLIVSNSLRLVMGVLLSALSGVAFMLAFPPYEIWFLVFIGWVPLQIAQFRIIPKRVSSIASATALFVWFQGYLGPIFAPLGTFMIWLPLAIGLLSLLADARLREFHHNTRYRWFIPSGVLSWAGIEMIRLFIPIAGTWAFIAYPLYRQVWLIQPVSIFGIIGLGMLIIFINLSLAMLIISLMDQKWKFEEDESVVQIHSAKRWAVLCISVLAAWVGLSQVLYTRPPNKSTINAAAIQPWSSAIINSNQDYIEQINKLRYQMIEQSLEASNMGAELIVWPEGSLTVDPQVDSSQIDFGSLAQETGTYMATGYVVIMEEGFRNEATVVDPHGKFLGVFGKDHPVIFGGETSLSRGTYPVYDTSIGKLATIICYDLDYTDTTRKIVRQGAQIIAIPSNDWSSIADKHFSHVVFRAAENRVAMVKADGGYDSAIIDPKGNILSLASFPQGGEATLISELPLGDGKGTVTTFLGDWVGWISLAGMVFFAFSRKSLEKRAR